MTVLGNSDQAILEKALKETKTIDKKVFTNYFYVKCRIVLFFMFILFFVYINVWKWVVNVMNFLFPFILFSWPVNKVYCIALIYISEKVQKTVRPNGQTIKWNFYHQDHQIFGVLDKQVLICRSYRCPVFCICPSVEAPNFPYDLINITDVFEKKKL